VTTSPSAFNTFDLIWSTRCAHCQTCLISLSTENY